jgi:NAD(P)H-hydrate repair Nnr-like enzyme with NAD(P)H-hydrate dehydratase domain
VLGSGVDPSDVFQVANIETAISTGARCIIDAGAMFSIKLEDLSSETAILTPHAGELARLLDGFGRHYELDYEAVQAAASITRQVVILKGNTSLIAHPSGEVLPVGPNSPALATAGTGDVLAGLLGALLAANPTGDLVEISELGVRMHSEAGSRAAALGSVVAMDVVASLRSVVLDWSN